MERTFDGAKTGDFVEITTWFDGRLLVFSCIFLECDPKTRIIKAFFNNRTVSIHLKLVTNIKIISSLEKDDC